MTHGLSESTAHCFGGGDYEPSFINAVAALGQGCGGFLESSSHLFTGFFESCGGCVTSCLGSYSNFLAAWRDVEMCDLGACCTGADLNLGDTSQLVNACSCLGNAEGCFGAHR